MDSLHMRFGKWNIRSLYKEGLLKTEASKLAKYKLDLVAVQEVTWNKDGSQQADNYTFYYGNGNANHHSGTSFFIHQVIK
jgi:exonuclease III